MKLLNAALVSVILSTGLFANAANAGLILSDSTVVTTAGQDYSQVFDVTGFEDYTNLVFTVSARGDYGTLNSELIEFFLDDTSFGQFNYNTAGVTSVVGPTGNSAYDYVMDFSFTISDADWSTVYANDSELTVGWSNADNVYSKYESYVNFTLSGDTSLPTTPIPEPTTLAIFALGMIAFASRRFKKNS